MDVIIRNGLVFTGDGSTVLEGAWIGIEGRQIIAVSRDPLPESLERDSSCRVIDASGMCVFPGIINTHTHGCTVGPLFSSGAMPLCLEDAIRNAGKHLEQGTTTLINACGLGIMDEVRAVSGSSHLKICCGTSHFPSTFKAAKLVDGKGLGPLHLAMTASGMLSAGAVAIGEIGSGATLGGGVSCYKYIPEAIERETGMRITREQAAMLKDAAFVDERNQKMKFELALESCGLGNASPGRIKELISDIVEKPVKTSLESFDEASVLGAETGIPVIFHTASESVGRIEEVARRHSGTRALFVAGHSNHPSLDRASCVAWARKLRNMGVVIDISSLNGIRGKRQDVMANTGALLSEHLADTITTDYGGGDWDGILELIQHCSGGDLKTIARLIGMATGRPADLFPSFSGRGYIGKGKVADIVLARRNDIGRVESVLVDGKITFDKGAFINV